MNTVLVAGAGPVGLTAAANLAHFGVPVRIIDSRPAPTKLSKALVIWRRSLLTLDPLVPYEHWMQGGRPAAGVSMADNGAIFASLNLAEAVASNTAQHGLKRQHELPPGIMITQSQIEAGLTQLLQDKYGIKVERSTQLESFTVDPDNSHVRCVLSTAEAEGSGAPQQQEVLASYLVGCDGARSAVRKALGVPFNGFTDERNRFYMMDVTYQVQPGINSHQAAVEAEGAPALDRPLVNTSPVGMLLVIPVVDSPNTIRVVWNAGPDGPAQPDVKPTVDDFQQLLLQHTRLQVKLQDVLWQSEFVVNERQVDTYVHHQGRVLLAGDAAHVHSPAGGQGMNTGIQDAANLAWKLALAAAGDTTLGPELLQTYQEERHPVGEDAVKLSGMLLRGNAIRNPLLRLIRRTVLSTLTRIPPIQQRLTATIAEDTVSYHSSSLAVAPGPGQHTAAARCAGTAFPDVGISICGQLRPATDLLRGADGTFGSLVLFTPSHSSSTAPAAPLGPQGSTSDSSSSSSSSAEAAGAAWPTHWGHRLLHVTSVARRDATDGAEHGSAGGAVDTWGLLAEGVGGADGVLVRPDGMIAAAGSARDINAWLERHGFAADSKPQQH